MRSISLLVIKRPVVLQSRIIEISLEMEEEDTARTDKLKRFFIVEGIIMTFPDSGLTIS